LELIGLYLVGCALLVLAGVAKVFRPDDTARALSAVIPLPLARTRPLVRAGAIAEAALGAVALIYPRTATAGLVALSYAAFAVFVLVARAKGGAIANCGCFGTPDTPATVLHVLINLGLLVAGVVVAATGPSGTIVSILSTQPLHGLPLVLVSALCVWLSLLAISVLGGLQAVRHLVGVTFRS
jgi:hypothetical protein